MNTRSNATFLFYLTMFFLIFNTYVTIENSKLFIEIQPNIFENKKQIELDRTMDGTVKKTRIRQSQFTQEKWDKQKKFAYIFPVVFLSINKWESTRFFTQNRPWDFNEKINVWWHNYYFSKWNIIISLIFLILGFCVLRNLTFVHTVGIFKIVFLLLYVHFAVNMIIGIAFVLFGIFSGAAKRKD